MAQPFQYRAPRFLAGLDVGQMADPSALVVIERQMRLEYGQLVPYFFCGHLERIPLHTPYPAMARGVKERLEKLGERCMLVIDATGVGRGVVDLMAEGWVEYDTVTQERLPLPSKPAIMAVTLTVGLDVHAESWDEQRVPKRDVIMAFLLCLQQQRFQAPASLPDVVTLIQEAQNFQWKVTAQGDDLYGAWRAGQHDDLLLATCLAVWAGERYAPVSLTPAGSGTPKAIGTGNPLQAIASRRYRAPVGVRGMERRGG